MKGLKIGSSRPLLPHAILGAVIASAAVSLATPASAFSSLALRNSFACGAGCSDAGDFYVLYGGDSMNTWAKQVGTFDNKAFITDPGYSNKTNKARTIADGINASFSDPVSPSILDKYTKHTVTNKSQYWAGIRGDDVNTWDFTNGKTTGFWAKFYSPNSQPNVLQLTIHDSTFTFNPASLGGYKKNGWLSLGVIAKNTSFDQVKWTVENGNSNLKAYEGWKMKNLKVDVPEPLTTAFATALALGFGVLFQKSSKHHKKEKLAA